MSPIRVPASRTLSAPAIVPRLDGVDLIRGLSILAVVLLHISIFAHRGNINVGQGLPPWLRYLIFSNGGNGVSAFFVVSGFLLRAFESRTAGQRPCSPGAAGRGFLRQG